jgi:hypothetical protein
VTRSFQVSLVLSTHLCVSLVSSGEYPKPSQMKQELLVYEVIVIEEQLRPRLLVDVIR